MIPNSHKDLIENPHYSTLATVLPNGQPHTTIVWRTFDGTHINIITSRGLQKEKNMQANPHVSIMTLDPTNPNRYLEVRGIVDEITEDGAMDKLNEHAQLYTGHPTYYGHIVPAENEGTRTHVICKIKPTKVKVRD